MTLSPTSAAALLLLGALSSDITMAGDTPVRESPALTDDLLALVECRGDQSADARVQLALEELADIKDGIRPSPGHLPWTLRDSRSMYAVELTLAEPITIGGVATRHIGMSYEIGKPIHYFAFLKDVRERKVAERLHLQPDSFANPRIWSRLLPSDSETGSMQQLIVASADDLKNGELQLESHVIVMCRRE